MRTHFRNHTATRLTVSTVVAALFVAAAPLAAGAAEPAEDLDELLAAMEELDQALAPTVSDSGEEALADVLADADYDVTVLDGLIDETVASADGYVVGEGSLTALGEEGDDLGISTSLLESGVELEMTVEGAEITSADSGVTVATGDATGETFIAQTTAAGGQLLYVMETADASEDFEITVDLPVGFEWTPQADGALHLTGSDPLAAPLAVVEAPWAIDATGAALPTAFQVTPEGIVQTIDTTGAEFPVVADPSWWWWASTTTMCVAEIGTLLIGGVKVVAAFAKADKIIKASRAILTAYNKLGGTMSRFLDVLKRYVQNKKNLTAAQATALREFMGAAGTSLMNILGIGSCWAIYQELR